MIERSKRERLRLERQVVDEILAPRNPSVAGDARYGLRAVVVVEVRVSEAHVEPRRIESGRSLHGSLDLREERVEILQRPQIERPNVDVEVVKSGEGWFENVELTLSARGRDRSRDVRVGEG